MNKNKNRGDAEERRIAEKLDTAFALPFKRQVLSGAAGRCHAKLQGDIYCASQPCHLIEVKFRRRLTPLSVQRGHSMINCFIADLHNDTDILIVITGTEKGKRKKHDWIFATDANLGDAGFFEWTLWKKYAAPWCYTDMEWYYTDLDKLLAVQGAKQLFGINKNIENGK